VKFQGERNRDLDGNMDNLRGIPLELVQFVWGTRSSLEETG
jgi:hypothetical protein